MKKDTYVQFEKLSDDYFNGLHPNDINAGHIATGVLLNDIKVGERATIAGKQVWDFFATSIVTEILDKNTFKTLYSTYRVTKLKKR